MLNKEKSILLIVALSISFLAGLFTPVMYENFSPQTLPSLTGETPNGVFQSPPVESEPEPAHLVTTSPETPIWEPAQTIFTEMDLPSRLGEYGNRWRVRTDFTARSPIDNWYYFETGDSNHYTSGGSDYLGSEDNNRYVFTDTEDLSWSSPPVEDCERIIDSYFKIGGVAVDGNISFVLDYYIDRTIVGGVIWPVWEYTAEFWNYTAMDWVQISDSSGVINTGWNEVDSQNVTVERDFISNNELLVKFYANFTIDNFMTSSVDWDEFAIGVDKLIFYPHDFSGQLESAITYSDPELIELKVEVECPEFGTIIKVYIDPEFTFTRFGNSIDADYTYSDGLLTLTNTMPITYDLRFTKQTDYFLAIDDKTSNYFSDVDFEGSYENDWYVYSTDDWDDRSLNSSVVYDGLYSLRLSDSDANNEKLDINNDLLNSVGGIYVSFAYYVESWNSGNLYVEWDGGNSNDLLSTSVTNRWIHKFYYMEIGDPTYNDRYLYFTFSSGNGIVFFDSIEIWQVNHEVETFDYSNTLFSGVIRSWDGYSNPVIPSFNVSMELRDRTDDTTIKESWCVSDENGIFYWLFKGTLTQKEYEFRSWIWESWFGSPSDIVGDYATEKATVGDWYKGNYNNVTESLVTDRTYGEYSYKFEGNTSNNDNYIYYDPSGTWDLSFADYCSFYSKFNDSTLTGTSDPDIFVISSGIWQFYADSWEITESFAHYYIEFDSYSSIYTSDSRSSVDYIRFDTDRTQDQALTVYFDELKFIQAQKSYFTPIGSERFDFAMSDSELRWGSDGWDFQESVGSTDGSEDWDGHPAYFPEEGAKEGYWWGKGISGVNYAYLDYDGSSYTSIDSSYWNTFTFRFWSNISFSSVGAVEFILKDSNWGNTIGSYEQSITANIWYIIEMDLSINSNWLGIESDFMLMFYESSNEFAAGFEFKIDWIRLSHSDSDLETGISWEFEEEEYEDGGLSGAASERVFDGKYIATLGAVANEYISTTYSHTIDMNNLQVWIKLETTETDLNMLIYGYRNPTGSTTSQSLDISSGVNYLLFDLDSNYNLDHITFRIWQDSGSLGGTEIISIEFIRLIRDVPINLWETPSNFILENEGILDYITFSDSLFIGYATNSELIPKNLSVGSHSFIYSAYYNYLGSGAILPSIFYYYEYTVSESDWDFTALYFDLSDFFVLFAFETTWNNLTGSIYENGSLKGTFGENEIFSYERNLDYGVSRNVTIVIDDVILEYWYKNAEAPTPQELAWIWLSLDVYGGSIGAYTTWGNTSIEIFDNGSSLTTISEGETYNIPFDLSTSGLHNISVLATSGSSQIGGFFSYSIAEPTIPNYRVWFDYIDGIGLGLPWETFKLFVNTSRQHSQELTVSNGTLLCLEVFDYFNTSLTEANYTITNTTDIAIIIDVYELLFRNNNTEFTAIVNITRGTQTLELQIPKESTVLHRFTEGTYTLETFYLVETEFENIKYPENFTLGTHDYQTGSLTIGSTLKVLGETQDTNIIDVGAPIPEKTTKGLVIDWLTASSFLLQVLGVIIGVVLGYVIRTRLVEPVDKRIQWETGKEKFQDPTVRTSSKILDSIPGFKPEKKDPKRKS